MVLLKFIEKVYIKRSKASRGLSEAILSSKILIFNYLRDVLCVCCLYKYTNFLSYLRNIIFDVNKTKVFSLTDFNSHAVAH